jgi:hypothetical protein
VSIPDNEGSFSKFVSGVACNGLIWVAVGLSDNFSIAWSPDAQTWTQADNLDNFVPIFGQGGKKVACNGQIWVAVGSGDYSIATSQDGKYWKGVQDSKTLLLSGNGISWNKKLKLWIAVGGGNYSIVTSPDGNTWTPVKNSLDIFVDANAIKCNEQLCIAVGNINYGPKVTKNTIAYSSDGMNWTPVRDSSNFFSICTDISWDGSKWIAVGVGNDTQSIAYSYDGVSWNSVSSTGLIKSIASNETLSIISSSDTIVRSYNLENFTIIKDILTNGGALGITWWNGNL